VSHSTTQATGQAQPHGRQIKAQGRTFGAPGLTALAVSSEDGRGQSRGKIGRGDPP